MNRLFFFSVLLCFSFVKGFSQSSSKLKKIQELEAQLNALNAEIDSYNSIKYTDNFQSLTKEGRLNMENVSVYKSATNTTFIEFPDLTNEQFIKACELAFPKTDSSSANTVLFSKCIRKDNQVISNAYIIQNKEITISPELKTKEEIEKELNKIQGQKEYYYNMIRTLEHEMAYNFVEIVDDSGNLLMKNLEVINDKLPEFKDILEKIKNYMVSKVRNDLMVDEAPINNPTYNFTSKAISLSEKGLKYIPGGSIITNHYLWALLKSTPDVGKLVGSGGAMINIYFRKNDFKRKLEELQEKEKKMKEYLVSTENVEKQ